MEEGLPPGFRFHPTDEELVAYYLTRKVTEFGFSTRAIADVDLNKIEPWDLPGKASMGEKEWYFFSMRDRKYPTGLRTNRATDAGYWKTTGKDKEIFQGGMLVGMKKTLVFYRGRAPRGEKTCWVMHEYRLITKFPYKTNKEEWVVCRVFKKTTNGVKPPHAGSPMGSPGNGGASLGELGELDVSILGNLMSPSGPSVMLQQCGDGVGGSRAGDAGGAAAYVNWMLSREAAAAVLPWSPAAPAYLGASFSSSPAIKAGPPFSGYGSQQRDVLGGPAAAMNLGNFGAQEDVDGGAFGHPCS